MRNDHSLSVVTAVAGTALALIAAGCSAQRTHQQVLAAHVERCTAGELLPLGSAKKAYVGVAQHGAVAYRTPGRHVAARFGSRNVNDYPTLFGITGAVVKADCTPRWYRVQLPMKPNGSLGYVRAASLELQTVDSRIEVDVSARRLTLFEKGKRALTATVAVGSPSTPTPIGRYYVNQRLIPSDTSGPFGPGAIGVSAFSDVLTGWAQGGPIAIHGTNEPWSIGHAVSNGCIRLPNATLSKLFRVAVAGTPVIIHP
jgi:lipoprotein-anchoring transpeptidase ErfK/SrfK